MRRPRRALHDASLEAVTVPAELAVLVHEDLAEERSVARLDDLRREYFFRENEHDSFCEVQRAYCEPLDASARQADGPPPSTPLAVLRRLLQRDSLEDTRRRHGLDRLRDSLFAALVEAASFEEGLEFLRRHIRWRRVVPRTLCYGAHAPRLAGASDENLREVAGRYPDMTADEVSLCALLADADRPLLADRNPLLFHPVSIVGMDTDGLHFSDGSWAERDVDSFHGVSPYQVGGITGVDLDTHHFPFRPEVATAVKALVVLRIGSTDLFDKLFREEDAASLLRGDAMLLKERLLRRIRRAGGAAPPPGTTLDDLLCAWSAGGSLEQLREDLRGEAAEYLGRCVLRKRRGSRYSTPQVVRLLGLLERLPSFVSDGEAFSGYVVFYGGNLEFIRDDGTIADAVPLVGYLKARLVDDLRDRTVSSDRTDNVLLDLFSELRDRIVDRNIASGHRMPLDAFQEKVLAGFGVLIPIHVYTRVRRLDLAEFHIAKGTKDRCLRRSLKFGFEELRLLERTLSCLPRTFLEGVRAVAKRAVHRFDFDVFVRRQRISGRYKRHSGTIEIFVPLELLAQETTFERLVDEVIPLSQRRALERLKAATEVDLYGHYLLHVFLHEVAESILAMSPPEILACWSRLCPPGKDVSPRERRRHFLSLYGAVNPKEDFCETFAVYVLCGEEFRKRARRAPVLQAKYDFMKALFSHDGVRREYGSMFPHSMEFLLQDPRASWEDIDRAEFLWAIEEDQRIAASRERTRFAEQAMSYSDLEEVIEEHEESAGAISAERAAEILHRRLRERSRRGDDGDLSSWRRYQLATWKATELLLNAGALPAKLDATLEKTFSCVLDRPRREAMEHLKRIGVKQGRRALLDRLAGIFQCFESAFRSHFASSRKRPGSSPDEESRIIAALAGPATRAPGHEPAG